MSGRFQRGDVVLRYDYQRGRLMACTPHVVVDDSPERVALYVSPGTPCHGPAELRDEFVRRMLDSDWVARATCWHSNHVLRITPPRARHSVDLYWRSDDWALQGWYIDLLRPLRREDEFETEDHVLDLWIDANRRWDWKDEDDFCALSVAGYWSPRTPGRSVKKAR